MTKTLFHPILAATALALLLVGAVAPAAAEELTVPLSRPDQPASVAVKAISGTITVEGYDGREVRIESSATPSDREDHDEDMDSDHEDKAPPPGMHRIPNRSFGLSAEEADNQVDVRVEGADAQTLHLLVPRNTSVTVKTVNGGAVTVRGVNGEHELSNVNGAIRAEHVSGSVVAHTTNGGVSVSLDRADPGKPMSLVTLNGDVEITLPPGFGADLRLQTTNGEIYTDFDFAAAEGKPRVQEDSAHGRYRVEVKQEVRGSINGGGPEIRMQTFNGDVLVRKAK